MLCMLLNLVSFTQLHRYEIPHEKGTIVCSFLLLNKIILLYGYTSICLSVLLLMGNKLLPLQLIQIKL